MRTFSLVTVALLLTGCAGCGDDLDRGPVAWEFSEETFEETPTNSRSNDDRPDRPNPNPPDPSPDPGPGPTPDPGPGPSPEPTGPSDTEPLPRPCSSANPPPRCETAPEDAIWASAAVLHRLRVMGTETEPECCFDFNGDGELDNSWGTNLAGFGFLTEVNELMQATVQRGEPAIVLELAGLSADRQGPIRLNWWLGGFADDGLNRSGTDVLVESELIDSGSQPFTTFANARIDGSLLTASGGTVLVPFILFFSSSQISAPTPVRDARIEADVLPGPFPTLSGRLGGVIRVTDTFAVVNRYVEQNCDCLGLSEPLLAKQSGLCSEGADGQACAVAGEETCAGISDACNLYSAIGLFADRDTDADGLADSVSIGMRFDAWPATIVGTQ